MVLIGYVLYISFEAAFVSLLHDVKGIHLSTTETEDNTRQTFFGKRKKETKPPKKGNKGGFR